MRNGVDGATKAVVTELRPIGVFATWQAERVISDHDRNTLRLRLDPVGEPARMEPGDCLDRALNEIVVDFSGVFESVSERFLV
jgi:hypothetical protein